MKDKRKQFEQHLIDSFAHWEHIYTYGAGDPLWEDGVNLNLVRNHIIYYRRQLEEIEFFPEIYNRDIPREVDNKYMARSDEIREAARKSLERYKTDENLKYLMKNANRISQKQSEQICLGNVIGYMHGLEAFIESDSLVEMRRHENPNRYLESFQSCREKMEKLLAERVSPLAIVEEKTGQLTFAI